MQGSSDLMPCSAHSTFEILPLVGVGPVRIGMSPSEVRGVMDNFGGLRLSRSGRDYFLDYGFQVEYGAQGARCISISGTPGFTFTYRGINVFDANADELYALIAAQESGRHTYDPDEHVFPD